MRANSLFNIEEGQETCGKTLSIMSTSIQRHRASQMHFVSLEERAGAKSAAAAAARNSDLTTTKGHSLIPSLKFQAPSFMQLYERVGTVLEVLETFFLLDYYSQR